MRWVKLENFTYRDFKEWCVDKKIYGYWTYEAMFACEDVLKSMRKVPPWRKKKVWNVVKREFFAEGTIFDIMEEEDIKKRIQERQMR